jgi:hypothetical protein
MELPGHVENGVVILDGGAFLPEGARVVVSELPRSGERHKTAKGSAELPLVTGGKPGSIQLTGEQIHDIIDEDDIAAMRRSWDVPS